MGLPTRLGLEANVSNPTVLSLDLANQVLDDRVAAGVTHIHEFVEDPGRLKVVVVIEPTFDHRPEPIQNAGPFHFRPTLTDKFGVIGVTLDGLTMMPGLPSNLSIRKSLLLEKLDFHLCLP